MIAQIQKLLSSLFKKSTSDAALTDKETALIGSTRVQILRYVIDSASLSLDESMVTSLAEYIASCHRSVQMYSVWRQAAFHRGANG